jgi:hypothetical protein
MPQNRSGLAILRGLAAGTSEHAENIRRRKMAEMMAQLQREGQTHYLTEQERIGRTGYGPGGTRRLGMELGLEEEGRRYAPGGPAETQLGLKQRFAREAWEGMPGYQPEGMGERWMGALGGEEAGLYGREQALERGILPREIAERGKGRRGRGGGGKPKQPPPLDYGDVGREIDDIRQNIADVLKDPGSWDYKNKKLTDVADAKVSALRTRMNALRTAGSALATPQAKRDAYVDLGLISKPAPWDYPMYSEPAGPPALEPLPPISSPVESDEEKLRRMGYTQEQIDRYK